MDVAAILVPIVVGILVGWFFYWNTNRTLIALFGLITSLPGGQTAQRIYEDMRLTKQVRGVPYLTENGKWAISWKMPPYKDKLPKP